MQWPNRMIRDSLGRIVPRPATTADEMEAMRRRAWLRQGVVVLNPAEITDVWFRQALINEAERRYGKRGAMLGTTASDDGGTTRGLVASDRASADRRRS